MRSARQKFTKVARRYTILCTEILTGCSSRIKLMSQERLKETRPRKAIYFLTIRHKKCFETEAQGSTI